MYQVSKLKLITGHFKRSFFVFFTIMTLFFIAGVARADEYIDFENYNLGLLHNQNGWTSEVGDSSGQNARIENTVIIEGLKTLWFEDGGFGGQFLECEKKFNKIESNGKLSIKQYASFIYGTRGFTIRLYHYVETPLPFYIDVSWVKSEGNIVKALDNFTWVNIGNTYPYIIYDIIVEWNLDTQKYRVKIGEQNFSNWLVYPYYDINYPVHYVNSVEIGSSWQDYFDALRLEGTECDLQHLFNCYTFTDCNNAGGWWDIGGQVCFAFEQLVVCGLGNNLQYCDNETACLDYGGYWYNDFCYEAQLDILDFNTYYQEHSDFDTPTSFVVSLAGFVAPFLQTAGNFLETFKNNFVITQATEKGYLLGSAISQARGYLDIINDFFGGLPVADMLLLFIIVIVLISVSRLVIKLIHIVKP